MFNCYKSNKKLPKVSYEGNQERSRDLMLFNGIACSYIKSFKCVKCFYSMRQVFL